MAEAKHEAVIDVPLKKFYETILDFSNYSKFASGVKASQILEENDDFISVHMDLEMINRIEYDIEVHREFNESSHTAKVWWTLKSGDLFKKNNGSWELTAQGDSKTHVNYSLDVEFNFTVPGFILKNLIKKSLPGAVKDFHEETKRRL